MKNRSKEEFNSETGTSLVEVTIAFGLLGLITLFIAQQTNLFAKAGRDVNIKVGIEEIQRSITENLDCNETFARSGINPVSQCSASSGNVSGPWLTPYIRKGIDKNPMFSSPQESDGSRLFGNFQIRVTCSSSEASLIVQALPAAPSANRDWQKARVIVGSAAKKSLCFNSNLRKRVAYSGDGTPGAFKGGGCNENGGWGLVGCYGGGDIAASKNGCNGSNFICFRKN